MNSELGQVTHQLAKIQNKAKDECNCRIYTDHIVIHENHCNIWKSLKND